MSTELNANQSEVDELSATCTELEEKLREATSKLDQARIDATERFRGAATATHDYIRENPWRSLGVVAAVGLVIGALLSRR
jgi:ElaB/YqjD/DUF883 family membrane-anchored ribosome-binding protein